MTNTQATINFVYFTTNFPSDFISKVWADDPHLAHHLTIAFKQEASSFFMTAGDFIRWFQYLDRGNQTKLVEWINENYRGISL